MSAIEQFCLASGPDFVASGHLVQKAGWTDPIARTRAELNDLLHDAPIIWRSPDGVLTLSAGVALKSISEPHTSCSVSTNFIPVDELIRAAKSRFGEPDAGKAAQWYLGGSPKRELIVVRGFGGEANTALVVVDYGNWSTAAAKAPKKSSN